MGHIHRATYTRTGHTHGRTYIWWDIYTEGHTHKDTYTRTDIHTDGHPHGGTYTRDGIHMKGTYAWRDIHTTHDEIYTWWGIHMDGTYTRREIHADGHTPKVGSDFGGEVSRFFHLELTGGVLFLYKKIEIGKLRIKIWPHIGKI